MKEKPKTNPLGPILDFFSRYNLIIFLIIIVVGLSSAVLTVSEIIKATYDENNRNETASSFNFDEATINELGNYYQSSNNANASKQITGRTNLFTE